MEPFRNGRQIETHGRFEGSLVKYYVYGTYEVRRASWNHIVSLLPRGDYSGVSSSLQTTIKYYVTSEQEVVLLYNMYKVEPESSTVGQLPVSAGNQNTGWNP